MEEPQAQAGGSWGSTVCIDCPIAYSGCCFLRGGDDRHRLAPMDERTVPAEAEEPTERVYVVNPPRRVSRGRGEDLE